MRKIGAAVLMEVVIGAVALFIEERFAVPGDILWAGVAIAAFGGIGVLYSPEIFRWAARKVTSPPKHEIQGKVQEDASPPTSSSEQYVSPDYSGTVTLEYSNNDGKYRFGEGKHKFVIHWSPRNHDTVHLRKVGERGHMALVTDDEIKDPSSYNKADRLVIGEGQKAVFQNGHGNWATIEIISVEHEKRELQFCYAVMQPARGR